MNLVLDDLAEASLEAGSTCSLENYLALPDHTMDERIARARAKLGSTTLLLGHHYQRDEVIRFADATGDSYKLSRIAAETDAKYIVFCGVHFMAESADVLGHEGQQVILPDLNADFFSERQRIHCGHVSFQHPRPLSLLRKGGRVD